ncbi:hypothetical protein [Nonomuraea sp. NPDC023979]|uniref:hypothetical protein n=1 Tax=Nonomuraea sp. NPDC023979 TaxID=3154796 RepID=UPI0033EEC0FF
MTSVPFTDWGEIPIDQIRHTLDENWSTFHIGLRQYGVHRGDLDGIRARRQFAQTLAGQAAMWDKELAALEEVLAPTSAPEPDLPAAPEPPVAVDEPYGGDDPALDKAVEKVATLPETRRAPARRTPGKGK